MKKGEFVLWVIIVNFVLRDTVPEAEGDPIGSFFSQPARSPHHQGRWGLESWEQKLSRAAEIGNAAPWSRAAVLCVLEALLKRENVALEISCGILQA